MPLDGSTYVTKPDVLSVEGLAAWLRTQDGATVYYYARPGGCLLHNYLAAAGRPVWLVSSGLIHYRGVSFEPLPKVLNDIAVSGRHTYAAALSRCNDYLQGRDSE